MLVAGLLFTGLLARNRDAELLALARVDFEESANRLERDIVRRISVTLYGLQGGVAAIAAVGTLDRATFQRYVAARDMDREFPGVRGFGFVERVSREGLADFVERERRDGAPAFDVRTAGSASDLYVIKYIEPLARNQQALGFDIGSEAVRRAAVESAVRGGKPALTGRIVLLQDQRRSPGWLLVVPVFRSGSVHATPAEREQALVGLMYAPLVAAEVLAGSEGVTQEKVGFELFDGIGTQPENLLYDADKHLGTPGTAASQAARSARLFSIQRRLVVAGRDLTLQVNSTPAVAAQIDRIAPWLVAGLGGLVSVLLALLTFSLASGGARARAAARGMVRDIDRLASVMARTSNAVFGMDRQGRITWINEGFTRLTGYTGQEALGHTMSSLVSHPRADPAAVAQLGRAMADQQGCRVELLSRRKDGSDYWVETELQPTLDARGMVDGFMEIALDITERKLAAQRLVASEAFLAQAERIAGVGGWEIDVATWTLRVTPQLRRLFGIAGEAEVTVEQFLGFFAPPDRERIGEAAQRSVKTGSGWDLELALDEPVADVHWIRSYGQVERDGAISKRLIGVVQDVTDRREMEEELRLNNMRLQAILENLPCGLSVFDGHLRLVARNTRFKTLLELPDDLFAGRDVQFEDIIRFNAQRGEYGQGDVEAIIQAIVERARHPVPHQFERSRPDGTQLEIRGAPMPGGGFVTTYVDATDRIRAEEALRASEDLMRVVTDNIPGRVAYWDRDLRCRFVNRRYCDMVGKPRDELLGRTVPEVLGAERFARLEGFVAGALRGEPQQFERTETGTTGRPVTLLTHYIPDLHEGGTRGFFVLSLDVSELREARDAALEASQSKSQFLANMSHEIRTPMNAILGMLALLAGTGLTTRQLDYLTKTEGAARSLLGLLNDILDFSKVEAGKLELDIQPFAVETLLRDLSVILAANTGGKNVEVLFDMDPLLPPRLVGDDMRLRQILINLGGNAIKFTQQGEVVIGIQIRERMADRVRLEISVSDTGIGIAQPDQARIFTGFTQAESSTTRRFGGTGLGLAICQRLVRMMGGELQLHSTVGRGSRFSFELLLPVAAPVPGTAMVASARGLRVLIVDDNAVARRVMVAMALSLGWQADVAASGEQAMLLLQQEGSGIPYDVVLLDWRMPGLDGWETSRRIRAASGSGRSPLLLMVTAQARNTLGQRGSQDEGLLDGFLVKPVTASMLLEAVQEALAPAVQAPIVARGPARRLAGLRLLVVEDNPINQQVARELLAAQGASVQVAVDGRQGVDMVVSADPQFDAILMDVQMPVMDGLTATRELRRFPGLAQLPVIAMTANAMGKDRDACLEAGMNDYVSKPFELAELVATIERNVARSRGALSPGPAVSSRVPAAPAAADFEGALARLGGDANLYRLVYGSFRVDAQAMVDGLAGQLAAGQRAEAQRTLHTLKGLAATLGADAFAAEAQLAEAALEGPAAQGDGSIVDAVRAAWPAALAALDEALAKHA